MPGDGRNQCSGLIARRAGLRMQRGESNFRTETGLGTEEETFKVEVVCEQFLYLRHNNVC